jgi:S23 ribosomal protein.
MSAYYQDLIAWQKAISLAECAYELTEAFPKRELYGLARQIRNAAVSVPANIAEGHGRITRGEWQQFLGIARGSLHEVETELILAARFRYIDQAQLATALNRSSEVGRLINGLLRASTSRAQRKPFDP